MKEFGGYFGFEAHQSGINSLLNEVLIFNGRSSLSIILQIRKPKKLFIPFFICDSVLEAIRVNSIDFSFIEINEDFEFIDLPELKTGELIMAVNYFGLKNNYIKKLCHYYQDNLIIDATQTLELNKKINNFQFNSLRKYFGLPDGSEIYVPTIFKDEFHNLVKKFNYAHHTHSYHLELRKEGKISEGYVYYRQNEELHDVRNSLASKITYTNFSVTQSQTYKKKRIRNFNILQKELGSFNKISVSISESIGLPIYYPFMPLHKIKHQNLWNLKIFAPILWPEVLERKNDNYRNSKDFAQNLLPLPIDHRYSIKDMIILAKTVKTLLNG